MPYDIEDVLSDYANSSLSNTREVACFIDPNFGVVDLSTDKSSGHVDFKFEKIWDHIRGMEYDLFKLHEVWMIHSHPCGFNQFSGTDWNMLHGWSIGLAIPINFGIVTKDCFRSISAIYNSEKKIPEYTNSYYSPSIEGLYGIDNSITFLKRSYVEQIAKIVYGLSKTKNIDLVNFDKIAYEMNMNYPPEYKQECIEPNLECVVC